MSDAESESRRVERAATDGLPSSEVQSAQTGHGGPGRTPRADDTSSTTIALAPIDETLLAQLASVAIDDASAADVTPPLTAGDSWTPQRVEWFMQYHRSRRAGLDGGRGEATWAIIESALPVGSVRLKRTDVTGVLETGIWIARSVRGRGIAEGAMRALIQEARGAGALALHADTTATNSAAQRLLRTLGFALTNTPGGAVRGELHLR